MCVNYEFQSNVVVYDRNVSSEFRYMKQGRYPGNNITNNIKKDLKQGRYPGNITNNINREKKMTYQTGCLQNAREIIWKIVEPKQIEQKCGAYISWEVFAKKQIRDYGL